MAAPSFRFIQGHDDGERADEGQEDVEGEGDEEDQAAGEKQPPAPAVPRPPEREEGHDGSRGQQQRDGGGLERADEGDRQHGRLQLLLLLLGSADDDERAEGVHFTTVVTGVCRDGGEEGDELDDGAGDVG